MFNTLERFIRKLVELKVDNNQLIMSGNMRTRANRDTYLVRKPVRRFIILDYARRAVGLAQVVICRVEAKG